MRIARSGRSSARAAAINAGSAGRSPVAVSGSGPATAASRCQKRDATDGAPPSRAARVINTVGAPAATAKSCAIRPMVRDSPGRSSAARTAGARKGSGAGAGGHVPSLRPPRIIRSARCSRASRRPQMASCGCRRHTGRTVTRSVSARRKVGASAAVRAMAARSSPASSSSSNRRASARPPSPSQSAGPTSASAAVRQRPRKAAASAAPAASSGRSSGDTSSSHQRRRPSSPAARAATRRPTPDTPGAGRRPRKASRSSCRTRSSQARRPSPARTSGCFSSASSGTGAKSSDTASASASIRLPAGTADSGCPALSSTIMPKRCS